jgi:Asp-tRNA(Asn)/Glu-tRNA(Gln) amidotransferase A subunit family amidase
MPPQTARDSARETAARIARGELSAEALARELLECVRQAEPRVQAWAWLDPDLLLAQARDFDERVRRGQAGGSLAGLPVAVKDIVDVAGMPTEDGTVLHAGRVAGIDSAVVAALRRAGGLPMGKTVTTELATYAAGKTRNPHDPAFSPGGSSSGSAAAVAAGMTPLAIGTQTNGSVIRPAAFCGVVGYKPSAGSISRAGVLVQSPTLDQIGVFARTVEDAALLAQALFGHDERDRATRPLPAPPLLDVARSEPPAPPRLAWVATPWWDRVAPDARAAFGELLERLAGTAAPCELPPGAAEAIDWHRTIMEADIAGSFEGEYERGRDSLSPSLRAQIERGRQVGAVQYRRAVERAARLDAGFDRLFADFDAILTPATLGTAPRFEDGTGDPLMCTLWTLCGMPAVSLPLLRGANGLPLGVQLVGRRGDDARLLRTARWLAAHLASA